MGIQLMNFTSYRNHTVATYYPSDVDNYNSAQVSIAVTVNASAPGGYMAISFKLSLRTNVRLMQNLTNGSAKNVNNGGMQFLDNSYG